MDADNYGIVVVVVVGRLAVTGGVTGSVLDTGKIKRHDVSCNP